MVAAGIVGVKVSALTFPFPGSDAILVPSDSPPDPHRCILLVAPEGDPVKNCKPTANCQADSPTPAIPAHLFPLAASAAVLVLNLIPVPVPTVDVFDALLTVNGHVNVPSPGYIISALPSGAVEVPRPTARL